MWKRKKNVKRDERDDTILAPNCHDRQTLSYKCSKTKKLNLQKKIAKSKEIRKIILKNDFPFCLFG